MDDLRPAITFELGFQTKRGLINLLKNNYGWKFERDEASFDQLAEAGVYFLGDPDEVARQLQEFYDASGGFGTLLLVTGKDWATRDKRARSLKLFMEHVAPKLRHLDAGPPARQRRGLNGCRRASVADSTFLPASRRVRCRNVTRTKPTLRIGCGIVVREGAGAWFPRPLCCA